MPKFYLFWIAESADILRAPHCEIAADCDLTMYEYCKHLNTTHPDGQYVVMSVKTVPTVPFGKGKFLYVQSTCSVHEFINNFEKEYNHHEV